MLHALNVTSGQWPSGPLLLTTPDNTVDDGSDRAVRLDLGLFIVGAVSTASTSNDACAETQRSPGHSGHTCRSRALMAEAWQQGWK
jgi:hypothetical protein